MTVNAASAPLHRLLGQTADTVSAVRAGRSLTDLLGRVPAELRGGTQALSFQALRSLGGAEAVLALMASKPAPSAVSSLLVVALALLWPGDEPPPYAEHTLVDQAVTAARARTPAAANFVNAVLRRFLRERGTLVAQAQRSPAALYNHPLWWIERLRQDWPAHWQALLAAANRHPPMALRVNARRASAAAYAQRLAALGHASAQSADLLIGTQALVLGQPCPVLDLPGFADGDVSVQDLSAQQAVALLLGVSEQARALPAGARVLDACAAPGGKTAQLLELADLDLLALDSDVRRLDRVRDTLTRLHLGGTAGCSMRSCSMRRARLLASCAAIPTFAGCAGPKTWSRWPPSSANCWTRCGRCSSPVVAWFTPPARSSKPKASSRSTLFCNAMRARALGWTRYRRATCCACRTIQGCLQPCPQATVFSTR